MELTGTNRPRACLTNPQPKPQEHTPLRVCPRPHISTRDTTPTGAWCRHPRQNTHPHTQYKGPGRVHRVTAAIATGKHPDPYRTRKLSLPAPMVLPPRGGGRVGRRRTSFCERATSNGGPFVMWVSVQGPVFRPQAVFAHPLSTDSDRDGRESRWPASALVRGGDGHEGRQGV